MAMVRSWLDDTITATFGFERVRLHIDDHRLTSDNARDIGRALLEAADYADGKVKE